MLERLATLCYIASTALAVAGILAFAGWIVGDVPMFGDVPWWWSVACWIAGVPLVWLGNAIGAIDVRRVK